jgi:hypothetical protein
VNPAGIVAGLAALGGGLLLLTRGRGGYAVVLYSDNAADPVDVGTFREAAELAGETLETGAAPVGDGAELLAAVQAVAKIKTLLIIGHGTTSALVRPGRAGLRIGETELPAWVRIEDFAAALAPRLVPGFWLGLLGCRTAAEGWELDWTPQTLEPEGEDSLAGRLRDALVAAGAPSGKIGGHTTTGGTITNPRARVFPVIASQVNRPGIPVALTQGDRAIRWAFTGK